MKSLTRVAIRGAIQAECAIGEMTIQEIAEKYKVSKTTVMKWKFRDSPISQKRKRKSKLGQKAKRFLYKAAANKFTGSEKASSRRLQNKLFSKFQLKVSHVTVNKCLRKILEKPRRARKTFLLTENNKGQRRSFADYIEEKCIKGHMLFVTDEKIFHDEPPLNPQTDQMRLTKKGKAKLKAGNEEIVNKLAKPIPKFPKGFMVAGGISSYGPGKLIFCCGTVDGQSYRKALEYFREDVERLNQDLYFQQDNARCHTAKKSVDLIRRNFNNKH